MLSTSHWLCFSPWGPWRTAGLFSSQWKALGEERKARSVSLALCSSTSAFHFLPTAVVHCALSRLFLKQKKKEEEQMVTSGS